MTAVGRSIYSDDVIKKEFISLCKDLPAQIPLEYGRKEMKPYRFIFYMERPPPGGTIRKKVSANLQKARFIAKIRGICLFRA